MGTKLSIAGSVFSHGMAAYGAYSDYNDSRNNGRSRLASVAKAGTEFALGEVLGFWGYTAYNLAKTVPSAVVGGVEGMAKMQRSMNKTSRQKPFGNAYFNDHSQAMTMRQAGMQMAQASRYNLQQAILGNEAQYLR